MFDCMTRDNDIPFPISNIENISLQRFNIREKLLRPAKKNRINIDPGYRVQFDPREGQRMMH